MRTWFLEQLAWERANLWWSPSINMMLRSALQVGNYVVSSILHSGALCMQWQHMWPIGGCYHAMAQYQQLYLESLHAIYKPHPCNETTRQHLPPCCRTRWSTRLDQFPHFGFQNGPNIKYWPRGRPLMVWLIFGCMFWGAHVRLINPILAMKPPANIHCPVAARFDQPI